MYFPWLHLLEMVCYILYTSDNWVMCVQCCESVCHTHYTQKKQSLCSFWVMWSLYTQMVIEWCPTFMDMVWTDCMSVMHCIAYFRWHELFHGIPCQKYHRTQVLCRARTNIRYTVSAGLFVSKGEYHNLPLYHYNELIKLCSISQSEESTQDKLISTWALPPAIHNHPIRILDISKFGCNYFLYYY